MQRPNPNHDELDRIRFLAAHYNALLGLRALPFGVLLILAALVTGSLVTGTTHTVIMWSTPFILVGAAALGFWAHRRYGERFGRVVARRPSRLTRAGEVMAGAAVLGGALLVQWVGWEAAVPFSPAWAIFWAAVLAWALTRLRFVRHYGLVAGVGLLLALLPLGFLPGLDGHPYSADKWGAFATGLLLLLLAFLDHRYLSRVLVPGSQEDAALKNGAVSA